MLIRAITLAKFMAYDAVDLELPERGLVLVTGPNGAGKSSLPEAVSVCVWGKSLRGASPWREGEKGMAVVDVQGLTAAVGGGVLVSRERSAKDKGSLDWQPDTGDTLEFDTPSLAQSELLAHVGPWERWRRTHVFSSQDAAHFTLASDGDRKRLIEAMIGLGKFDPALKRCREELRTVTAHCDELSHRLDRLGDQLTGHQQRLEDAERSLQEEPPDELREPYLDVRPLLAQHEELDGMIRGARADAAAKEQELRELERSAAGAATAVTYEEQAAAVFQGGECPTCGQVVPRERIEEIAARIADAKAKASALQAKLEAERELLLAEVDELEDEERTLRDRRAGIDADISAKRREHEAWQKNDSLRQRLIAQHDRALAVVKESTEAITTTAGSIEDATRVLSESQAERSVLEAVEEVLGLKGVRAHVLGQALAGIEAVANRWLERIAGAGFSVALRPYTENKTGGVTDAISLEVHGAGGGRGYKASSGGERRRIDVALLMALAEVAGAASGVGAGTLWFDEVFDALDTNGVEAVSAALAELAQDRPVVVISHADSLVARLPAAMRIRVENGAATVST